MAIVVDIREDITLALLDGELTIYTIADLQDELFGLLNHDCVALDLSALEDIDSCGAQALAIIKLEATSAGKAIYLQDSNPAVDGILALLGITPLFQDRQETENGSEQS